MVLVAHDMGQTVAWRPMARQEEKRLPLRTRRASIPDESTLVDMVQLVPLQVKPPEQPDAAASEDLDVGHWPSIEAPERIGDAIVARPGSLSLGSRHERRLGRAPGGRRSTRRAPRRASLGDRQRPANADMGRGRAEDPRDPPERGPGESPMCPERPW